MELAIGSTFFEELLWSSGDLPYVIEVSKDNTDWKMAGVVIDFFSFVLYHGGEA